MFQGGYMGHYLYVDVSDNTVQIRELNEEYARLYIGGPALGARMLWDMMEPDTDPLAPESVCGFVAAPLNATGALFGGRYTFVNKSPVYNGFNDANSGGFFGPELKKAGFDALFMKGRAETPVYLLITDNHCEICDASKYWGMEYFDAEEALKKDLEDTRGLKNVRCAGVGPAGERGSHMAAVMNDEHRAAARGGPGAVLGSKNIKMVAVSGSQKVPVFDREKMLALNKEALRMLDEAGADYAKMHGTGGDTPGHVLANEAGVKNWSGVGAHEYTPEEAEKLGSPYVDGKYKVKKYACSACALGCGAIYHVTDSKYPVDKKTARPEYETGSAFTSLMLMKDPDVYIYCNDLCNRYGFDTMSAGGTLAWVIECFENGELTKEELDGVEPTWGNGDAVVALMEKMCRGEGCGAILQHGSQYASEYWGKGQQYLMTYSGIEPGHHDPRRWPGLARTYQYDPVPGRHVKGGTGFIIAENKYDFSENGPHTGIGDVQAISYTELESAVGLCQLSALYGGMRMGVELWEAVTGWKVDLEAYGRRSFLMRLSFGIRDGLEKKDFTSSPRLQGCPPMESGPFQGVTVDVDRLSSIFFEALGCDQEHFWPYRDTLISLGGLDDVAEQIGLEK